MISDKQHCLRFTLAAAALALLAGCSSLPEGAQKPVLKIDDLTLADTESDPGFNLDYTLRHNSPESLQVKAVNAEVFLNQKKAGTVNFEPEEKMLVPPYQSRHYRVFVPANLMGPVAKHSLQNNPMVKIEGSAALSVIFDKDEESKFNPSAEFSRIISHKAGELK